jgi:hypothetical protein
MNMTNEMTPDTKTQRAMLEQKRDQFKQVGFDNVMEAEAAKVQNPGPSAQGKKELADHIKTLEAKAANAYASAKRMQAMIDELPAEEAKPDGETDAE